MAEKVEKKITDKKVADKKATKKKDKKPNIFAKIAKYFRECKAEVKKITWPAPKTVFKNFGVVLVIMIVMGLFIFALDSVLFALLDLVTKTSAG